MSFNVLPNELLEHIFGYCERNDHLAVGLVCHRWAHVVETLLLRRTCLKVSYGDRRYGDYGDTLMIDKAVLEQATRQYTCLRVEWGDRESAENLAALHELWDVCQERFPIQRLFIRGTPDHNLARIFGHRRTWLQDLQELHVELGSPYDGRSTDRAFCELSLPKLQKLTWLELKTTEFEPGAWGDRETDISLDEWYAFVLIAPELSQLKVRMNGKLMRRHLRRRSKKENGICELFLPSLELKIFPNLQNVEIEGLLEVNRSRLWTCVRFLQNLKVLTFVLCHSTVIRKLCSRCCNLRELTIIEPTEGPLSLQVSETLSPVLEKFTFRAIYHSFERNSRAHFPKLRYLKFQEMCIGLFFADVSLVAPQLSTFIAPQSDYYRLILPHKEQIRTMAMELDSMTKELATPPPNVTELFFRLDKYEEDFSVPEYLKRFPNLRRLTLAGVDKTVVDGALLTSSFPHLEYFHAHHLRLNLSDFRDLASLQSIILTECTVQINPGDDDAPVTIANHFRAELVTVDAGEDLVDRFPIGTNERQPPIEPVEISDDDGNGRRNVFSSRNFHMRLPDGFQHILKPEKPTSGW